MPKTTKKGKRSLDRALDLFRRIGDQEGEGETLYRKANWALRGRGISRAKEMYQRARTSFLESTSFGWVAACDAALEFINYIEHVEDLSSIVHYWCYGEKLRREDGSIT